MRESRKELGVLLGNNEELFTDFEFNLCRLLSSNVKIPSGILEYLVRDYKVSEETFYLGRHTTKVKTVIRIKNRLYEIDWISAGVRGECKEFPKQPYRVKKVVKEELVSRTEYMPFGKKVV